MQLIEILKNPKTVIVDVRTPFEFAGDGIKDALNIPLDEIPGRLEEFKNFNCPIVLHCLSGGRSANALAYLKANGITNIYDAGGIGNISLLLMNVY
ncbi:MAG: rhodanese-like domain-containing protein [Bacteroidia bacterium]|nr:rhodanese-like domain-containing protein [Bacteroidia bacterium]